MPWGSAWSFITNNEAFSRASFRGVTWSKLGSNSQAFDISRRRSVADCWFYRQCHRNPEGGLISVDYCENDENPWVGNVFCTPRASALHIQTAFIMQGSGQNDLAIAQKIGVRKHAEDSWRDFPDPVMARSSAMRGHTDEAWQLSDMQTYPIDDEQHEFHAWDQQRLAEQVLPFDGGKVISDNLRGRGWKVVMMDPQIVTINGDQHRLTNPPARKDDLGRDVQVKVMKRFQWTVAPGTPLVVSAKAYMVGIKIHELSGEE